MTKIAGITRPLALSILAVTLMSCGQTTSGRAESATLVPITDFTAVAGKWTGLARPRGSERDDWVELTIRDDGTYEASSARTIGAFTGSGSLRLDNGKLTSSGEKGSSTYTLYYRGGARILLADFTSKDGIPYSAELTIAR
jgi:hypothetical protein